MTGPQHLLGEGYFQVVGEVVDGDVPTGPGVYALRLNKNARLPEPFNALLEARSSRLIYIGKATSLYKRMLRNELRARGHGTLFRSIGAVLGFLPSPGSLAGKANQFNYRFGREDRDAIVRWISENLEVSWLELPQADVKAVETRLIIDQAPLLNLAENPKRLAELDALRVACLLVARG